MWKNRIIYILCICAGIYYALLYDKYVSLAVLWCIITVPPFSALCLFFWKRQVKVEIAVRDRMVKMGEELLLTITMKNSGIFPIAYGTVKLEYKHQLDEAYRNTEMICRGDVRGEERIQLNFYCNHCGLIELKCDCLKIYDYFRLFSVKVPIKNKQEVMVIPEFEIMEELVEDAKDRAEHIQQSNYEKGEDTSEIIGIREYHPGDHPKKIHWKLSSKKKQILIKEFSREEEDVDIVNFGLICEEEECGYEWYDEKMEELVNTCWTLLQVGRVHKVVWYHPQSETYETTKIHSVEDIGNLAEQVIRAGVGRLNKEDIA